MAARSRLRRWADRLAVEQEAGLKTAQLLLINHDLKPVEPPRRLWGPWNFVGFWIADSFNVNTWMISSSMIAGGLAWWQAWLCVWVGYAFAAVFIVSTGRIGAVYHIGFPVVGRASFGIWGSLWPVVNRVAMACVWYGVQSYVGGGCIYLMIRCLSLSWDRAAMPGPFAGSGSSTPDFVSFVVFWLVSLPALWFPVHTIRHLFTVKAYLVPPAGVAFLIWAVVRAGGLGPVLAQPNSVHGAHLAWELVRGVMSSLASFATLIVNDCDFSRFARRPADALWSQLLAVPLGFALTSLIGIIASSASTVVYGAPVWNPLVLLANLIDDDDSGSAAARRFGVFVIALAFALATVGTNIAANSVSAGTDMAALLPRYINIRRGGFICAAVGLAVCPYKLVGSASSFVTYLSAYSVFLSSIAGVMVADYYVVRRGYLDIGALYDARPSGPYYYSWGVNWRAYVAYVAGILINIVGFAGAVGASVPSGAIYLYNVNFFCGFAVAAAMYWGLCRLSPVPATRDCWTEVGDDVDGGRVAYGHDCDEGVSAAEDKDAKHLA